MGKKRLLKLTWVGSDGEPYYTAELSPTNARSVIALEGGRLRFHGAQFDLPLHRLTYPRVARERRCPVVRLSGGREIVIDVASS